MKQSEFLKWLIAQGVETREGTKHIKLFYNGKQSHLPRHPGKELKTGLVQGIKKQLGLK
ncbi:type II toxin-antitoxin system HicA family toxin [Neisseria musculi]|uniref:YcfA-like family protein n=1 Tax=Neisseria musculi TaxID=1815583 RepID=A0A7H1MFH3_9NEIS|nr:type II toxin-antitoxin system HicA family toxin [Neisseria musculi]QNT60388.1 ycfA-like family protein [Neisseria musculi]